MDPRALLFALPLLLIALLLASLAGYAFRHRQQTGALTLGLLLLAMAEWSAGYAAELLVPTLSGKLLAAKAQYVGIASLPPLWLTFALRYTGYGAWLTNRRRVLLAFPAAITFLLVLTNEWHELIWVNVGLSPDRPALYHDRYGPAFWFHAVVAYTFVLTGAALHLASFIRASRPHRRQGVTMLLGAVTPLVGNAVYLAGFSPLPWLDLTPFFFALSGSLLALGFFRFGLLELFPVAANIVLEHLQDAVVVVDLGGRISNFNPAAARLFDLGDDAIGCRLDEAIALPALAIPPSAITEGRYELNLGEGDASRVVRLSVSPLKDEYDRSLGRLLVVRDITREHDLLTDERRRAARERLLTQTAATLIGLTDPETFWPTLGGAARELLAADRVAVYLYDRKADRLTCPWALGLSDTYREELRHALATVPEGRVLETGGVLVINEALNHPATASWREVIHREGFHAYAVFPLRIAADVVGALAVYRDTPQPFAEDAIAVGQTLAHVAAVAFQNLRLLAEERRRNRQMALLNEITQASLREDELKPMLQALADRLGALFDADGAYITFWDEEARRTIPMAAYGPLRERYPTIRPEPGERTLTESVLEVGHPLPIEDIFNTPYVSPRIPPLFPTRSMLALPLIVGERKLGAALIAYNDHHTFIPAEVALGEQAAGQIALAVAKIRLLEAEREQRNLAEALRKSAVTLGATLDIDIVLDRLLEEIANVVPYDAANVMLIEPSPTGGRGRVRIVRMRGYEQFGAEVAAEIADLVFDIDHTANLRWMFDHRRPLIIPETAGYPGWISVKASAHVRSWAGAPIIAHDRAIAFFSLDKTEPGFYRPEHVERLAAFSGQAAIALENARLHAQVRRRAEEQRRLFEATRAFTAVLDERAVRAAVARHMAEALGVHRCVISEWDAARDCVITLEDFVRGGQGTETEGTIYPLAKYPTTREVLASGRPLVVHADDPAADPAERAWLQEEGYAAVLMVPLWMGERTFALVEILRRAEDPPFDEDAVNLALSLVGPAGVAWENARLHAQVQALAVTDALTGVANRRAFDRGLAREMARAQRYGTPLALVIADIDSFKEYNDTFGHPAGDERLKAIAQLLKNNVRDLDMVARYGGEEFAILLPHTDKAGAIALAERLRALAEQAAYDEWQRQAVSPPFDPQLGYIPGYTLSLGVAAYPEDAYNAAGLVLAADEAELLAKHSGKNRVRVAGQRLVTGDW
ncbi:MAG: diguanylate cyclase [Caldilineales bacterium]|nr:diguanylate cyclase [Caldilineales bacterium]